MKRIFAFILATVLILALSACSTDPGISDSKDSSDGLKGAAILISSASETTTAQGNAMAAYAKANGVEFSVEYYDQNIATEAAMIENAISSGVDFLIIHNQSEGDCVDAITKAAQAGIVVVLYGTDVPDAEYNYLFTEDSYALGEQMGTMAAKWANEYLVANGEPVIAVVGNYSVTPVAVYRNEGIVAALEELCPEVQIVDTYDMAYKQEGITVGENILQAHPDVNMVVGINDQSVCGVYEAFVGAGLEGKNIGLFGIDGTAEAAYNISKQTIYKGILDIDSAKVGEQMVQCGIDAVNGNGPADKMIYWAGEEIRYDNIDDFAYKWEHLAK